MSENHENFSILQRTWGECQVKNISGHKMRTIIGRGLKFFVYSHLMDPSNWYFEVTPLKAPWGAVGAYPISVLYSTVN